MGNRNEKIDQSLSLLKRVANTTDQVLTKLSTASDRVSKKSSSSLFGTMGGLLGFLGAIGLTHITTFSLSLPLVSTPLTALGIAFGILFYRGRRRFRIERIIENGNLELDTILRRIKALPKGTPDDIVQAEWRNYRAVSEKYQCITLELENFRSQQKLLSSGSPNDEKSLAHHDPNETKTSSPLNKK